MLFNIAILNHIFILTEFSFKVVDYVQCCERIHQFSDQNFCNSFIFKQSDCLNMGYGIFSCISASSRMVILWTWTKRLKVKCVWLCSYQRFCANYWELITYTYKYGIRILTHFTSCAPAWDDPEGSSYIVYILIIGFVIPNIMIIFSSCDVLRYHKKVSILFVRIIR